MDDQTSTLAAPTTAPTNGIPAENTTDATRGEPIVIRAMKRKAELEAALAMLPTDDTRARNDIEHVLGSFESLLTGDLTALSNVTASDLNRLLERNKHLAETSSQTSASPAEVVEVDTGGLGIA